MIRKARLTRQFIFIFTFVVLLSLVGFVSITNLTVTKTYEQINKKQMVSQIEATEAQWTHGDIPPTEENDYLDVVVCNKNDIFHTIKFSKDARKKISANQIINLVQNTPCDDSVTMYIESENGSRVYYATKQSENGMTIIVRSDDSYMTYLSTTITQPMIVIFLSVLILGDFVIGLWSQRVVRRLHSIQQEIILLPENNYNKAISDYGGDELGDLARSIEDMREAISSNDKTKQEMLQNVSHDFKTPIAVIKSYAEAIMDGVEPTSSAETIIRQSEILKRKTYQLLEFNKLEYLEKGKPLDDVNMKEVIVNVLNNYRFLTNIEFETKIDDNIMFQGFVDNYYSVVDNIVGNATRYAETKIWLVLKKDYLEIGNDGPKLDEKFLNSSFKPYEKGIKGQFGLGMSIVQKTVALFNMVLIAENTDSGVRFIIKKK